MIKMLSDTLFHVRETYKNHWEKNLISLAIQKHFPSVGKKFKIDIIFNSCVFCNEFRFLSLLLTLEKKNFLYVKL